MTRHPDRQLARQWRDRLRRFDQSELTVAEFCELEDYSAASFYYWRRKLQTEQVAEHQPAFLPVDIPADAAPRSATGGGLRIRLPGGAVVRLDRRATDEQQRRLIKNIVVTLREVQP